ncbi:hypothetical protein [Acanthopleuribacter pedis]|uniref:Uncharacterized protein n=1 Tax=Acanthopleuribacter pedis TaxID=442870 RepID=A0A8J7QL63_9BACT|nr:hypothetical protein [Acanthopleuribacter pedis]MBO1320258.1 hypothetical protein [Acanthopleuribacter pedis]
MTDLFHKDELELKMVEKTWSVESLLNQDGIFYLKDIVEKLELDTVKIKRLARQMREDGKDPWVLAGIRKVWSHWIVRMKVFAPFYRENLLRRYEKVDPSWDGNTLLKQHGVFYLADVCQLIPFSAHQLRYQAKKMTNSREKIGVFKDPDTKGYAVDMVVFSAWIKTVWQDTEVSK